jgi:hypothetical protein
MAAFSTGRSRAHCGETAMGQGWSGAASDLVSRSIGSRIARVVRRPVWVCSESAAMSGAYYQTSIEAVRRWHSLSERRRNHVVELYRSERWRRYYTEDAFRNLMREAIQDAESWGRVLADMSGAAPAAAKPPAVTTPPVRSSAQRAA